MQRSWAFLVEISASGGGFCWWVQSISTASVLAVSVTTGVLKVEFSGKLLPESNEHVKQQRWTGSTLRVLLDTNQPSIF